MNATIFYADGRPAAKYVTIELTARGGQFFVPWESEINSGSVYKITTFEGKTGELFVHNLLTGSEIDGRIVQFYWQGLPPR